MPQPREHGVLVVQQIGGMRTGDFYGGDVADNVYRAPNVRAAAASEQLTEAPAANVVAAARSERDNAVGDD